ncbi:MAG: HEAT repeat domain-containing protein [Deltaproteobacteria bacterium]
MNRTPRREAILLRSVSITLAIASGLGGCNKSAPAAPAAPAVVAAPGAPGATPVAPTAVPGAPAVPTTPSVLLPLVTLDPAQTQIAAGLPALVSNGRFPAAVAVKANARPILWLADTSADPAVVRAALLALPTVYTHAARFTQQRELMGPEYCEVVRRQLRSTTPAVQGAAIRATVTCILGDTPNADVLTALVDLASHHPQPEGRYEAMQILWNSSVIRNTPAQMAPYVAALEAPEPWLVSTALFRINGFAYSYPDKAALATRLIALTQHADPGVRGRAAEILGTIGSRERTLAPQIVPVLMHLLDDPNAFTKSEAMNALASMDHRPALHRIVTMLDDQTSNTYDIRGFNDLLGSTASVHHDGSAWSRVGDAGLNAIRTFSSRMNDPFRYEIHYQTVAADLATSATAARAWFARHLAEVPQS